MPELLDILAKHNFWTEPPRNLGVPRHLYLTRLKPFMGNQLVKVLVGQRRAGKSYLLRQCIGGLLQQGVNPRHLLYLNKESIDFADIANHRQLHSLVQTYRQRLKVKGKVYLILDEIQEIDAWERVVNAYAQGHDDEYEIIVTGSNSTMLSSELGSHLSGRYVSLEVLPFSFAEFSQAHAMKPDKAALLEYIQTGGLPELTNLAGEEPRRHYVMALRDSILLNDVVRRHGVKDVALLEALFRFMCDSVGSLFSVNKLVKFMSSHGFRTNHETVSNYAGHLCEALLVHACDRHDIRGKQILAGNRKYFVNDPAFRRYLSSGFDPGLARQLENVVYLHFRRQGFQVFVGAARDSEIDFVVERGTERAYYQVCYLLSDETVIEREYRALERIRDNFPKAVLSLDDLSFGTRNGIDHIPIWQLLASQGGVEEVNSADTDAAAKRPYEPGRREPMRSRRPSRLAE
jgi:predicted AAA+ superfamily ATPase